jgi:hypothetical protein
MDAGADGGEIHAQDGASDALIDCGDGGDGGAWVDPLPFDPASIITGCENLTRS